MEIEIKLKFGCICNNFIDLLIVSLKQLIDRITFQDYKNKNWIIQFKFIFLFSDVYEFAYSSLTAYSTEN